VDGGDLFDVLRSIQLGKMLEQVIMEDALTDLTKRVDSDENSSLSTRLTPY